MYMHIYVCSQVPGTKGTYEYTLPYFHAWYHVLLYANSLGGVYYK